MQTYFQRLSCSAILPNNIIVDICCRVHCIHYEILILDNANIPVYSTTGMVIYLYSQCSHIICGGTMGVEAIAHGHIEG